MHLARVDSNRLSTDQRRLRLSPGWPTRSRFTSVAITELAGSRGGTTAPERRLKPFCAGSLGLLLACGCGARSESDFTEPGPTQASLITEVASLAGRDARLAKTLRARRGFVTNPQGFESSPSAPPDTAFVRLTTSGSFELALSRRNRSVARLFSADVSASALHLEDGCVLSSNDPSSPSIWLQSGDSLEQLRLSRSGAGVELDWRLELQPPIVAARRERSGALLLIDETDRGILRVPVPYGVDGAGERVSGSLSFELHRERQLMIDVHFSVPGSAHPPLLIDPALAVVLWQEREGEQPPSRTDAAMAYHPGLGATVLYGGSSESLGDAPRGDTWAYDGEWTQLEPKIGGPPRYRHGLAYSASPPSLLLFGGRDENGVTGSTYRWQAGAWTEVATTGPEPRTELAMTYAPGPGSAGDVVLFGGSGEHGWLDDTWIWNGSGWDQKLNADGEGGFGQVMVYDTARGRPLVFGGARSSSFFLSSLALFDGSRWIATPARDALTRGYAAMAFDSDRQRAVLFGGEDSEDNFSDETWEWDSATKNWSLRPTDGSPPPLLDGSMAYDPQLKRAVLFGGSRPDFSPLRETWEYRALGGSCETEADCDGVACVDGACCKTSECDVCEACSTTTGQCEPVVNEPDHDSCAGDQTCDAKGVCKQASATSCASDADCADGACADGVCCDRACDGACEACDVKGSVGTCSNVTGSARHGECPTDPICGGACDGESSDCALAKSGVACGTSCEDDALSASSCDGEGRCVASPSTTCPKGLGCDTDGSCRSACASDAECQPGLTCRDEACGEPAVFCADRSTLHELDGAEQSCAPFACVSGHCLDSCESAAQCAEGLVCDDAGHCLAPPELAHDSKGCGCRFTGDSRRSGGAAWALLLLGFVRCRRRAQKLPLAPSRGKSAKKARALSSSARK
jgi:galactose oxidase-like protein